MQKEQKKFMNLNVYPYEYQYLRCSYLFRILRKFIENDKRKSTLRWKKKPLINRENVVAIAIPLNQSQSYM